MTRLRSPIKQRGVRTTRWERWHQRSRTIVMWRAKFRCEACGDNMRPLEWAHLAGRNNKGIGEPWCSLPELTAGLCSSGFGVVGCHDKIDRALDLELLNRLRMNAFDRLRLSYPFDLPPLKWDEVWPSHKPLDLLREAIRTLEAEGWEWDGKAIVKVGEVVNL